jgi:hypothetical protein
MIKYKKYFSLAVLVLLITSTPSFASTEDVNWEEPTLEQILDDPITAKENWESVPQSTKELVYIENIGEFSQEFASEKGITVVTGSALDSYDGAVVYTIAGVDFVPEEVPQATVLEDGTLLLDTGDTILYGEIVSEDGTHYIVGEVQNQWKKKLVTNSDDAVIIITPNKNYQIKGTIDLYLVGINTVDYTLFSEDFVHFGIDNARPKISTSQDNPVTITNRIYDHAPVQLHEGTVILEPWQKYAFSEESSFVVIDGDERSTFSTEKGTYLCFGECKDEVTGPSTNPSMYTTYGKSSIEILSPTSDYNRDLLKIYTDDNTITATLENPTYDSIYVDTVTSDGTVNLIQKGESAEGDYYSHTIISDEINMQGQQGKRLGGNNILVPQKNVVFQVNTGDLVSGEIYEIDSEGKVSVHSVGEMEPFNIVSYHGGTPVYPEEGTEAGSVTSYEFDDRKSLEQQINLAILAGDFDQVRALCLDIPSSYPCRWDEEVLLMRQDSLIQREEEYLGLIEKEDKTFDDKRQLFFSQEDFGYGDRENTYNEYLQSALEEGTVSDRFYAAELGREDGYLSSDDYDDLVIGVIENSADDPNINPWTIVNVADDIEYSDEYVEDMRDRICEDPMDIEKQCEDWGY